MMIDMFLGSMGTSNVNLANLAGSTPSGVAGPASVASARASVVASVPGINGLGTSHATTTGLEALATAYTAGIHQFTTGGYQEPLPRSLLGPRFSKYLVKRKKKTHQNQILKNENLPTMKKLKRKRTLKGTTKCRGKFCASA